MENLPAEILTKNLEDLNISRSLAHFLEINKFTCLKECLDCSMEEWFQFTGFSQHLLNELLNFLGSNSLLGLVKE